MSIFTHSPDNIISINGTTFPLDLFLVFEPDYALPEGVTGLVYRPGRVIRYLQNGDWLARSETTWPKGDTYIAKEQDYKDQLSLLESRKAIVAANWDALVRALYPDIVTVPELVDGYTIEQMAAAWDDPTYAAPTQAQVLTAWNNTVKPALQAKKQAEENYSQALKSAWYQIVTADPTTIENQLLTIQTKLTEAHTALNAGQNALGISRMLEAQIISAQLGQSAMEHIKVLTMIVRELMRRGIAQDILTDPEEL